MSKRRSPVRYLSLAVFFILVCLLYVARLINIQISGKDYYNTNLTNTTTRRETITAERGEVFDRNGKSLIVNDYKNNLVFSYGAMPAKNADKNAALSESLAIVRETGRATLLSEVNWPVLGTAPDFYFDPAFFEDSGRATRFTKLLAEHGVSENITCEAFVTHLLRYYGFTDKKGVLTYAGDDLYEVLARRFDMEYSRFDENTPYVLVADADVALITAIKESGVAGVAVSPSATRSYCYPGVASHILGRTGKIPAESAESYVEQGYALDAVIGTSGVEAAFEQYLHGTDGVRVIVEDEYGYVVDEYVEKEPVPGQDVYLTIDIGMQIVAERALAENIQYIVDTAVASGEPLSGEDAKAGAMAALDVRTGEVLVVASYPTYNLATFSEDYATLVSNETSPLLNRALNGKYTPGSTFKIATAAAALTEGVINSGTIVNDTGVYKYFDDYQPACWIYNRHGYGHGPQNVTQAIQNSCNYFFFEVGRLLTIQKLDEYCRKFGLGEKTGIELAETEGVLDGPEYRETSDSDPWQGGDVLQVAIGQGKSQFSPLQICNYIATIINGGDRYNAHILSQVRQFGTDIVSYEKERELLDSVDISDYNRAVLLGAMKDVVESGSAASVFAGYDITIGGKTGTAQVNENKSANAVFTGFAPFDNPEIVVTVVVEQGNSGTTASRSVREVFDYYFHIGAYAPTEDGGEE